MTSSERQILTNLRTFLSRAQLMPAEIPAFTEAFAWLDQRLAEQADKPYERPADTE